MSSICNQSLNFCEHSLTEPKKLKGNGKEFQNVEERTVWMSELTSKTTPRHGTNEVRLTLKKAGPIGKNADPEK